MLPFPSAFAQSIGDDDELARDGRDDDLVWFPGFTEPISERFERRVMMRGNQRCLEHDMS